MNYLIGKILLDNQFLLQIKNFKTCKDRDFVKYFLDKAVESNVLDDSFLNKQSSLFIEELLDGFGNLKNFQTKENSENVVNLLVDYVRSYSRLFV